MFKVRSEEGYVTHIEVKSKPGGYDILLEFNKRDTGLIMDWDDAMAVALLVDNQGIRSWVQEF